MNESRQYRLPQSLPRALLTALLLASAPIAAEASNLNLLLPANGGKLESFTSEYGSRYPAAYLTNGQTNEDGWSSKSKPGKQEFTYQFRNGQTATLTEAVIHSGTAQGRYFSKNVEVWIALDGRTFSRVAASTLPKGSGSITLNLGSSKAKAVKLVITSGYRSDYWELAEFVVNGSLDESGSGGNTDGGNTGGGNTGGGNTGGGNTDGGNTGGGGTSAAGVSLPKTQFNAGETVTVGYAGATVGDRDWIGIYPAGRLGQNCTKNKTYTTFQYVSSVQGNVTFTGLAAGSYVAQLFDKNGYCFIGSAASFTIQSGSGNTGGGNTGGGNTGGGNTGGGNGTTVVTINPYSGVNWNSIQQYKANFHTHTTRSDGNDSPAQVIDQYHSAGYKILSLTDHDTITWPWTSYGKNPSSLNMLAVKGDEYSGSHHVNVFHQFSSASNNLQNGIPHVQASGGLCHINHPKRYSSAADWNWYLPWYRDYPSCVGIEVVNRDTVFPELWDNINENLFKNNGRLVWGFANDDTHGESDLYRSFQFMLMPSLTESALIQSKKNGAFYFCSEPGGSGEARVPRIGSIDVNNSSQKITLYADNYNAITWVGTGSKVVGQGNTFDFSMAPHKSFVRAVLKGSSGTCYTQPFGLGSK